MTIPPNQPSHTVRQIQQASIEYSGPLPPPGALEKYEQILPGAAERILKLAEDQSKHRQSLEKKVIDQDVRNSLLGIICAFLVSVSFIIASAYTTVNGHPVVGSLIGSGGLTGLVAVFIYGSRARMKERRENLERSRE